MRIFNRAHNPLLIQKIKNVAHYFEAIVASIFFRFPQKGLIVIGVTGTDGKTTTVNLIHHILTTAGIKAGVFSTLSTAHTSSPGRGKIHQFLLQCYKNKCSHAVLEMTSIGADQFRGKFIDFSIGVLTNIAENEHLDYHRSFENYRNSKIKFLLSCKNIIANSDDPSIEILKHQITTQKLITYGLENKNDASPRKIDVSAKGISFEQNNQEFESKLVGKFNLYNILAAISVANYLDIDSKTISQAVKLFVAPSGRMEVISDRPVVTIVDFAHTPQAFEKVLPVAKSLLGKNGRLIHVFGATGERDRGKRPLMAKISSKYSDLIILTTEDTYFEDPEKIMNELEAGIVDTKSVHYLKIPDRKEAIKKAIQEAKTGDVILITGVGHQKSMNIGGKEIPWSDQKISLELLKKFKKK